MWRGHAPAARPLARTTGWHAPERIREIDKTRSGFLLNSIGFESRHQSGRSPSGLWTASEVNSCGRLGSSLGLCRARSKAASSLLARLAMHERARQTGHLDAVEVVGVVPGCQPLLATKRR